MEESSATCAWLSSRASLLQPARPPLPQPGGGRVYFQGWVPQHPSSPPCHQPPVGNFVPLPVREMEGRGVGRALRPREGGGGATCAALRGPAAQPSGPTAAPGPQVCSGEGGFERGGHPLAASPPFPPPTPKVSPAAACAQEAPLRCLL